VLGREQIARLLDACLPAYGTLIATALFTGMRHSEVLGLISDHVDLPGGMVHVRAIAAQTSWRPDKPSAWNAPNAQQLLSLPVSVR
jgi:integrase